MDLLLKIGGGLSLGVIGAGVGRAAFVAVDSVGMAPDMKTHPKWRAFVSDALLVAGAVPGAMLGWGIGHALASKVKTVAKVG